MNRRNLLRFASAAPLLGLPNARAHAANAGSAAAPGFRRSRPGDPSWPSAARWAELDRRVDGRLVEVHSPLADCVAQPEADTCRDLFAHLKNPYYLHDQVGVTQTCGWVDAWSFAPSVYAVVPRTAKHVAAAVDFARVHNVRLVVKGGGHSYQGTSNAPDSLLVWTRDMDDIVTHDAFAARGCGRLNEPVPAVSVGAGAIWMHVYDAVTVGSNRYVQGGGCATVGVAGLVQSGGFGSFSKNYGTAAGGLIEAEVVTADGVVRVVNACSEPDLFWALRGGGGGTFGIVTRVTLRTHALPDHFGGVSATIQATSDASFRDLIGRFVAFYREHLFNAHWGEVVDFTPDNRLRIAMVFQGLTKQQATDAWAPFLASVRESPDRFVVVAPPAVIAIPARRFWDPAFLREYGAAFVVADDRPGASPRDVFWRGDQRQVGQYLYAYTSAWLPESLLSQGDHARLADAIFAATRHWTMSLHFNKGLAGAPATAIAEAARTAMNPQVLRAFALAISGAEGPPAYPGIRGHPPDVARGRAERRRVDAAMHEIRRVAPGAGSYVSESDFFADDWQRAYWGDHHARLRRIKARHDPRGLFVVHHGVGSEDWSADGFARP
jgi:FAD/FMN-containing dehydrogenase